MAGLLGSLAAGVGAAAAEAAKVAIESIPMSPVVDRELPERANLSFYFPNPNEGSEEQQQRKRQRSQ